MGNTGFDSNQPVDSELSEKSISKSSFIRGLQCPRFFYFYKFNPRPKKTTDSRKNHFHKIGSQAGSLARNLFPDGSNMAPRRHGDYEKSITSTREAIGEGAKTLYEAGFRKGRLVCFIDILVNEKGKWKGYEVKSTTGITGTRLMDASFQYHVIKDSGLPIEKIYLAYINNRYVRKEELEVSRLFLLKDVTREAEDKREIISEKVKELTEILETGTDPRTDRGEHCFTPYTCDYLDICWKDIPESSVFNISGLGRKEAIRLVEKGVRKITEVPENYPLTPSQRIQLECHREMKDYADIRKLGRFIGGLKYPLGFIDFEAMMGPVPEFPGTHPYQHIPFQYSLHIQEGQGSEPSHRSFLAEPGGDPRRAFIKNLLRDINRRGDILVYNRPYENGRLKELSEAFSEYARELKMIKARLKDLMIPFRNFHFYSPVMNGSRSLKNILPALVPGLSYEGMTVPNGFEAMRAFTSLRSETDKEIIKDIREGLLRYCHLDTLGMVKIVERLREIVTLGM